MRLREKYKIYKELNELFTNEANAARTNFWQRCKEKQITGFAWFMVIFPIVLVYGIYFACVYGPYWIDCLKTKRSKNQSIETCTPEDKVDWGEEDDIFQE